MPKKLKEKKIPRIIAKSRAPLFREPPKTPGGIPFQVAAFVEQLKKRPGEWAVYCSGNIARTGRSKAQQYKKRYPGSQWVVRREDDGYTVFGRWIDGL